MDGGALLWKEMKRSGAVWEHSGDKKAPHVVLRSGRHSNGFIDVLTYLSVVKNLGEVASAMAKKLRPMLQDAPGFWMFGSPMAGVPFATAVALSLNKWATRVGFTEKVGPKKLICRFDLPAGKKFLMIEEMTTSGATPMRGIHAVLKKNPAAKSLPFVAAFLIRCESRPPELDGKEIISLVSLPELGVKYNEWDVVNSLCPLCDAGSPAVTNCKRVWPDLLRSMNDPTHPVDA